MVYLLLLVMPAIAVAQDEDDDEPFTIVADTLLEAPAKETPFPQLRSVPDSAVNRYKDEKAFRYANDPQYWIRAKEDTNNEAAYNKGFWGQVDNFFSNNTVRTIIYIILGVLFLLILYRIVVVNNLFMLPSSRKRNDATETLENEMDDNNLEAKIEQAIGDNNYRAAIRFMYLKTLQSLNHKGWIRYHAQTTNNEYINQVNAYGVGNEFRFLTHIYEYVWYGEFALTKEQFHKVQQSFQHFVNAARL